MGQQVRLCGRAVQWYKLICERASYGQLERKVPLKFLILCNHHIAYQYPIHPGVPFSRIVQRAERNVKDIPSPLQIITQLPWSKALALAESMTPSASSALQLFPISPNSVLEPYRKDSSPHWPFRTWEEYRSFHGFHECKVCCVVQMRGGVPVHHSLEADFFP